MTTQLDLFGNPTEQTQESGEVLVRSHMRRVKGSPPAGNPPVASPAPQPAPVAPRAIDSARERVKDFLNGLYPHWATSRQIVAQAPCPERWVLRVLADLKAENKKVEPESGGFYLAFRLAPDPSGESETQDTFSGICEHCGTPLSITDGYAGINQMLRSSVCATCPFCLGDTVLTAKSPKTAGIPEPSPVPHNGTATSKAAAKHLEQTGAAETQIARILAIVKASGARGMTREEIHLAAGIPIISVASVCGRVNTLLRKGLLSETGETRKSSAGGGQAVVVFTEGREAK